MTASRGYHAAQPGHLEALCAKKAILEQRIREEMKHPSTSSIDISRLKIEKLRIKDRIELERKQA